MNPETKISLIRHGHVHNPNEIFYGGLPGFQLSTDGIQQAQATAHALQEIELAAIYSSPMLRARQTADILQRTHPTAPLHISELLTEIHTPYDGQPFEAVSAKNWNVYDHGQEGFEQPEHVLGRAQEFVTRVRQDYAGKHIAAVTHGDIILFLIHWAKKQPIDIDNKQILESFGFPAPYPEPASIVTLTFVTGDAAELPAVDYMNPFQEQGNETR